MLLIARSIVRAPGVFQRGCEFSGQLRLLFRLLKCGDVGDDRKEVVVLQTQKVMPQEIADTQKPGQIFEDLRILKVGEIMHPVISLEQGLEEFSEIEQGRRRIGSTGEQVREVLDQDDRGAEFVELSGVSDFLLIRVDQPERVDDFVCLGVNHHALNRDPAERQGIGEFVQEAGRVFRPDMHDMANSNLNKG